MLSKNLDQMLKSGERGSGMDVVIVVTSTKQQENSWQKRLEDGAGSVTSEGALLLAVTEDWPGGAGNGLGTLYAFQQAVKKAMTLHGVDLYERLRKGAACALYHTAGKGTRLAPLAASAFNDKSRVCLPGPLKIDNNQELITILEAVIKQTAIYAKGRKGRLSVFWGDQVFIPSKTPPRQSTHHADILVKRMPLPEEREWKRKKMSSYGLSAIESAGQSAQLLDKMDYASVQQLILANRIDVSGGVGVSLGSFSLSIELLEALLQEFHHELSQKRGKFDSDPHFWMPLTLDEKTYCELMLSKGTSLSDAEIHFLRMQNFHQKFHLLHSGQPLFGAVDVGEDSLWWDYGSVEGYHKNSLKAIAQDQEGELMRRFYDLEPRQRNNTLGDVDIDDDSIVIGCRIHTGKVRNSVLIGVEAESLDAQNGVVVASTGKRLVCHDGLFYHVLEENECNPGVGGVRADSFLTSGQIVMQTEIGRDGKEDWEKRINGNSLSYDELHSAIAQDELEGAIHQRKVMRKMLS